MNSCHVDILTFNISSLQDNKTIIVRCKNSLNYDHMNGLHILSRRSVSREYFIFQTNGNFFHKERLILELRLNVLKSFLRSEAERNSKALEIETQGLKKVVFDFLKSHLFDMQ